MTMPTDDRAALRSRLWADARLTREAVQAAGIAAYVGSLSNLADAFRSGDRAIRCIDGRTPGGVRLAGSGILLGLDKARAFAESARADRVTYHQDCGAARLWAAQNHVTAAGPTEWARRFAEKLAEALGVPCEEAPLAGPVGFHDEVAIYYDGTGLADPARVSGLPRGFVIARSPFGDDPTEALAEVRLAIDIAQGDHGFADLFTPATPLRLIPIGSPLDERFSLERLTSELSSSQLPAANRLLIDGFTAPLR
jgi:hypothetical protein